jgi:hypothetical protein
MKDHPLIWRNPFDGHIPTEQERMEKESAEAYRREQQRKDIDKSVARSFWKMEYP